MTPCSTRNPSEPVVVDYGEITIGNRSPADNGHAARFYRTVVNAVSCFAEIRVIQPDAVGTTEQLSFDWPRMVPENVVCRLQSFNGLPE